MRENIGAYLVLCAVVVICIGMYFFAEYDRRVVTQPCRDAISRARTTHGEDERHLRTLDALEVCGNAK